MEARRKHRVVFVLVGLGLLAGLALLVIAVRFWPADEPVYLGKPVSVWFKEYVFATNAAGPITGATFMPDGRMAVIKNAPGGGTVVTPSPFTNRADQMLWLQRQMSQMQTTPDPAWDALKALGSNAVPHLVKQLRVSLWERSYERAFTNLPMALQRKLPNPAVRRWYRTKALAAIAGLKDQAKGATPALLELLRRPEPTIWRPVIPVLRDIYADRRAVSVVLLQLGSQHRYADVIEIAKETGWEGSEMARLLGEALSQPDAKLRRDAITLLERAGPGATPALQQIVVALGDEDGEVRYMAARTLEKIGKGSPQVVAALRGALADTNEMVQNVSRRILSVIEPEGAPPSQ